MSMGDGNLSDGESIEQQPSLVQPKAGEKVEVGQASYNEEEFYSRSGGSAFGQDQFRLEDNKQAWDASLDAEVQATAELLVEQMRANPEVAVDVTDRAAEDLGEFADPLGLGVLNQSTMALESADSSRNGNARRQLKKMARWHAESTMRLGKADPDQAQVTVRYRIRNIHPLGLLFTQLMYVHVDLSALMLIRNSAPARLA
jgi:hypothetical protein